MRTTAQQVRLCWAVGKFLFWLLVIVPLHAEDFAYTNIHGALTILGYTGPGGNVMVPSTINGLAVTAIGNAAFFNRTNVSGVGIPASVTRIEEGLVSKGVLGAFSYCTGLTNVTLGSHLNHIGDGAFFSCTNSASIMIPKSVTEIGSVCFAFSPHLTAAYFEGDAPTISQDAFGFFFQSQSTTLYYLPGTVGWAPIVASQPTALWVLPNPVILTTSTNFGVHTDGFGFRISWATNTSVAVEASTNLVNPVWQTLQTVPLTQGMADFLDPLWTSYSNRFYRVRLD